MNIIYIVGFPIDGNSGKNKATREKARVLQNLIGKEKFCFLSSKKKTSIWSKFLNIFVFDIFVAYKVLRLKRNSVVIQRVSFMPLSRLIQYLKNMIVISEFHADLKDEIPHLNKNK